MQIKSRHILLAVDILTLVLILIIVFFPNNVLRIIIGLPLVLFFPGFVLTTALFPRKSALEGIERIAVSIGVSIAVVALLGLILNYTPWGINLYSILVSMSVFIILVSIIAWLTQLRLIEEEKPSLKISINAALLIGKSKLDRILTAVLVVIVLCAIVSLAYVIAMPKSGEQFTEFYVLGVDGNATTYPRDLTLGQQGNVLLGIVNHEEREIAYKIEVKIDDQTLDLLGPFSLADEQTQEIPYSFTPQKSGNQQRVQFLLLKDEPATDEQELHIWIDVAAR